MWVKGMEAGPSCCSKHEAAAKPSCMTKSKRHAHVILLSHKCSWCAPCVAGFPRAVRRLPRTSCGTCAACSWYAAASQICSVPKQLAPCMMVHSLSVRGGMRVLHLRLQRSCTAAWARPLHAVSNTAHARIMCWSRSFRKQSGLASSVQDGFAVHRSGPVHVVRCACAVDAYK